LEAIVDDCNSGVIRVAASIDPTVLESTIGHVGAVPSALNAVIDEKLQDYIFSWRHARWHALSKTCDFVLFLKETVDALACCSAITAIMAH